MLQHLRYEVLFLVTTVIIYCIFFSFVPHESLLWFALVFLAVHLADAFIRIVWYSLPSPLMWNLKEKSVFITGCDRGFGNRFARKLDKKGVTVFAGCLFSEGPDALKLKQECSEKLHVIQLDVTKEEEVKHAFDVVTKTLAGKELWALVSNAGIGLFSEAEFLRISSYQKLMDVNCYGAIRVIQQFLPLLRKSRGRVVIVTSFIARYGLPFFSGYSASKFALQGFAQCLRRELMRWSVSVHTIEPYMFRTQFADADMINGNFMKEWDTAPEILKQEYGGDKYVTTFTDKTMKSFLWWARPLSAIDEVVNCMIEAAVGKFPRVQYVTGPFPKIFTYVIDIGGEHKLDVISAIFLWVCGFRKGKSADRKYLCVEQSLRDFPEELIP